MDIVEELRSMEHEPLLVSTMNDAADEIERLRAELERCEAERLQLVDELRAAERRADEADRELLRLGVLP